MNLKNEFNRIGHLFHDGVDKTQHLADDLTEKQARMTRRVREQVGAGTRSMVSAEEALIRHVRHNPALYLIGAALLIGALAGKLLMESRQARQAPLL